MTRTTQGRSVHAAGIRRRPRWQRFLCDRADRLEMGELTLVFADGFRHVARGRAPGPAALLEIRSPRPLWRMLSGGGDLGFARSWIEDEVASPDLAALLLLAAGNEAALGGLVTPSGPLAALARFGHRLRPNSRTGSRRNIAFHYDLGNDFYRLWLDETMTYSSALFEDGREAGAVAYSGADVPAGNPMGGAGAAQTLAAAQRAKYDRILDRLRPGPDDHILEIGCGWGGFAEHAIRRTGCRLTGLTLSVPQAEEARARLARAGFAERSEIRVEDYRDAAGSYSHIVSIEMFEAVGEAHWPRYFETLRARLARGGAALIQTITIEEARFERYRHCADFIQTYIFPGGMLPSDSAFRAAAQRAGLGIVDSFGFGASYERTLLDWDRRFAVEWDRIARLGFDARFRRLWHYYLIYCAIGFRTRATDVVQYHLR